MIANPSKSLKTEMTPTQTNALKRTIPKKLRSPKFLKSRQATCRLARSIENRQHWSILHQLSILASTEVLRFIDARESSFRRADLFQVSFLLTLFVFCWKAGLYLFIVRNMSNQQRLVVVQLRSQCVVFGACFALSHLFSSAIWCLLINSVGGLEHEVDSGMAHRLSAKFLEFKPALGRILIDHCRAQDAQNYHLERFSSGTCVTFWSK